MSRESEPTAMLVQTGSPFEAETVAAALRDRGIDARVADAATTGVFGGAIGTAKVMVLASQENEARAALADIKAEGSSIDWEVVEPEGTPPADSLPGRGARGRRTLWV